MSEGEPPGTGAPGTWSGEAARRLREKLRDDRVLLFWVVFLNCVVIIGSAAVLAWLVGDIAVAAATAACLLAFVGAMLPLTLIGDQNGASPRLWAPVSLMAVPAAVLLIGAAALVVRYHLGGEPLDVTHQVRLERAGGAPEAGEEEPGLRMADADEAVVTLPVRDSYSRLRVTFRIADAAPDLPSCRPGSELTVESADLDGRSRQKVSSEDPLELVLRPGRRTAELRMRLEAEEGCELRISVAEATLHS